MSISACRGKCCRQREKDAAFSSEDFCCGFVLPSKGVVSRNRSVPNAGVESDLWKAVR
jgi:hypothetical protein